MKTINKITHNELSHLIQSGSIPPEKISNALSITGLSPNNHSWLAFIEKLLLWLGSLAIVSAIMFFLAYNWDEMGRFAKFGLVEALIAGSIFGYWKTQKNNLLISQISLLMASLFLGVLLAFYGQTYQTGADTWQLFFTWFLLITPWTFISRFPAHWIVWLTLLNISALIYFDTYRGSFGFSPYDFAPLYWIIILINAVAFIIWEVLQNKLTWLSPPWATRLLALASGIPLTLLALNSIFDRHHSLIPGIVWLIAMVSVVFVYKRIKPDLFMLAMACLSGISVIIGLASKLLFEVLSIDIGAFFILSILVIVLGGSSAIWLKQTHQEFLIKNRSDV